MSLFSIAEEKGIIATLEANIARGFSGPYAKANEKNARTNLEQHRGLLARLMAEEASVPKITPIAPASVSPTPSARHILSHEEKLRHVASHLGGSSALADAAIASSTSVADFAIQVSEQKITKDAAASAKTQKAMAGEVDHDAEVNAQVARIIASDAPQVSSGANADGPDISAIIAEIEREEAAKRDQPVAQEDPEIDAMAKRIAES